MQKGRGWADCRLSTVGGGGGLVPPLENEKKGCPEKILISHLCFTNEIWEGDRYTIHAKWKGVGGQALVHGGWGGRGGFAP